MDKIILSTKRVILRTWRPSDLAPMLAINANPQVMKYFPSTQNLDETQKLIDSCSSCYKKHGFTLFPVELKETSEFIGFVGLNVPGFNIPNFKSKSDIIVEIGWRLGSNHWNNGYATEAAQAALHYAFTTLQQEMVYAFTAKINTPSQHLMKKLGMKNSQQDFYHPQIMRNNQLAIHCLYQISKKQCQQTVN